MIRRTKSTTSPLLLAAALALGAATQGLAATNATMAPVAQYLMADRNAEVAMARSAAPPAISGAATVMVLGKAGYETAAKGTNGFVCLVERAWMAPFDDPDFWNPKTRGPVCYNPAAARSILPVTVKRTALALAGEPKSRMRADLKATVSSRRLPPLEIGAMSYMMSRQQVLGASNSHWRPHLMFYTPQAGAGAWGANVANSPVMLDGHTDIPEAESIFMIPVGMWSDGAPAALDRTHHH